MAPRTGIYVHWPYCQRICPYCDFNVTRARDVDISHWGGVLDEDLAYWAERIGTRRIESIYFGGGTPSLMPPSLVGEVIETVAACFRLAPEAEITIEANPTDAEMARFEEFQAAGVNRLSLGIQSFDDGQLRFLGRNHTGDEAKAALDTALQVFPQVTFDLIYALPDEGVDDWERRLSGALGLGAGHLSLYQLTIEPGTAFYQAVGRGDWTPADEDLAADLYDATQERMARAGMPAYEVSNHAVPGAMAVHNALYWQGADWVGIGPGAHGRLTINGYRHATLGQGGITQYLGQSSVRERYTEEILDEIQVAMERIAGGLRPVTGMPLGDLSPRARETIAPRRQALMADGLLLDDPDRLIVAPAGRLLVDRIVRELTEAI